MKNNKSGITPRHKGSHVRPKTAGELPRTGTTSKQSESEWHAQLAEDRIGKVDSDGPGSHPVGATSSANSASADPCARSKALGEPVPQVTRHI
mgnify:CR=1 FL=1